MKTHPAIETLKDLVSEGKIEIVIDKIRYSTVDEHDLQQRIILISTRWNRAKQEHQQGLMTKGAFDVDANKIVAALLDLLNEIQYKEHLLKFFDFEDKQFIIGLDFGDGETALAFGEMDGKSPSTIFEMGIGKKSLLSILWETEDYQYKIGEDALQHSKDPKDLIINFKHAPSSSGWMKAKKNIYPFVNEVLNQFQAKERHIKPEKSILYIGRPSSWKTEDNSVYLDYFKHEFGNTFTDIRVIPESRSALICAKENSDLTTDQLQGRILVVDLGSSTTDFTLLDRGRARELHFGSGFGCKFIEETIADQFIQGLETKIRDTNFDLEVRAGRRRKSYLIFLCRLAKEIAFGSTRTKGKAKAEELKIVDTLANKYKLWDLTEKDIRALPLGKSVSPPFHGQTWEESFTDILTEIHKNLEEKIDGILLTGGGSRMSLVKTICQSVFELPAKQIFPGLDPSFSVARGLVGHGRWVQNLKNFYDDLNELCEYQLKTKIKENLRLLSTSMMKRVLPLGYEKFAKPRIEKYINGEIEIDVLGDSLFQYAGKEVADWLNTNPEGMALKEEITGAFLKEIIPWMEIESNKLCSKYGISQGSLSIDFSIPANLFESSFTEFFSKLGTGLARFVFKDWSVESRKKYLSWLLNENVDWVIQKIYQFSTKGSLAVTNFLEGLVVKFMGKEESAEAMVKYNPFLSNTLETLYTEFSGDLKNKAEEIEAFIS